MYKRFLVTGGAGFIGSNLVRYLEQNYNASVLVIDNLLTGSLQNFTDCKPQFIRSDVQNTDWFHKANDFSPEAIIHLASITDTTVASKEIMNTNVDGFRVVLEYASSHKLPIVYASSASVYGNGKPPMSESNTRNPLNIYAESKAKLEDIAKDSKTSVPHILGMRYFNVYGENEKFKGNAANMVTQLYFKMKKGIKPRLFKFGEQRRDYIYVQDVVKITTKSVLQKISYDVLNVGTGNATSFNKIVEIIYKVLGTKLSIEYFDNPIIEKYQNNTIADISRLNQLINASSFYTIEQVLTKWNSEGLES
ncbi:MAG: NAD-dependent epimerase/dehydratase family protein [Planctomycetes bacterium]|nr:NAD-dependent epimerase/dehydratase family protein [Planctomycetota bacterium]